jgi:hypothetical protein
LNGKETNQKNAETNQKRAKTNPKRAETNSKKAEINQKRAATNQKRDETNQKSIKSVKGKQGVPAATHSSRFDSPIPVGAAVDAAAEDSHWPAGVAVDSRWTAEATSASTRQSEETPPERGRIFDVTTRLAPLREAAMLRASEVGRSDRP